MTSSKKVLISIAAIVLLGTSIGMVKEFNSTVVDNTDRYENWMEFEKAITKAESEGKHILIDFYTDWCSYCKKMDKEVYTDKVVKDVLDKHFVSIKINAESDDMITFMDQKLSKSEFAYAMRVSSYPTTAFMTSKAEVITAIPGYLPADKFSPILEYIGSGEWENMSFDEYLKQLGK